MCRFLIGIESILYRNRRNQSVALLSLDSMDIDFTAASLEDPLFHLSFVSSIGMLKLRWVCLHRLRETRLAVLVLEIVRLIVVGLPFVFRDLLVE